MQYGRVATIDLKTPPRPPAFAFVEFEDARDAEDAVHGRDGYDFYGHRLRVELARGNRAPPMGPPMGGYDRGRGGGGGYGGGGGGGGGGDFRGKGTGFRAIVKGLPMSASWQDLKVQYLQAHTPCAVVPLPLC